MTRALLLLLGLCWASAAMALPEQTWLLAIGNNTGDADEVPLRFAESDALAFSEVMRQLGGIQADRTRLLLDADADTVRRALKDLRTAIGTRSPKSALLVYYSGHADATALHLGGTRLPFAELRGQVENGPAALRLMIIDACRSGSLSRVKGGGAAPAFEVVEPADKPVPEGFAVLTSSAAGEASQESDRLGASFFSHHLVAGIRGAADRDGDRQVTLTEAYDYAYNQTVRSSGRTLNQQHPTYAFGFKGRGGLVLTHLDRPRAHRAGVLQLREPSSYVIRRAHASGPIAAEVAPERADAALHLPPGRYFVQQRLPRLFREYRVAVQADRTTALRTAPFESIEYDRLVRRRGSVSRSAHGLMVATALRGETVAGEGVVPQLVLGYRLDLRPFSLGIRVRGSTVQTAVDGGQIDHRHDELGVALTLERFADWPALSVGIGVLAEGAVGRQVFDSDRDAPDRSLATGSFGALLAVERRLGAGLGLRLEGGPLTVVSRRAIVVDGAQTGAEVGAELVWWAGLGLTWHL